MKASNDNSAVLTVAELAARWRCTPKSVLAKIRNKQLHAFRINKRAFRISMAEVLRHEQAS